MPVSSNLPEWCSWSYRQAHLPAAFHTIVGFEAARAQLHAPTTHGASQLAAILGIGLGLRDIMVQQEIEPGEQPVGIPEWLWHSQLSVAQVESLLDHPNQTPNPIPIPTQGRTLRKRREPQGPDVKYGNVQPL
jgi:hypothetical protein